MSTEIKSTKRLCKYIKEIVDLTAEVAVIKQGFPAHIVKTQLIKWKRCSKQNICGKKCNYFYGPNLADCDAVSQEKSNTFP